MQTVRAPNGAIFEFPDDATAAQIQAAMASLDQRTLVENSNFLAQSMRTTPRAAGGLMSAAGGLIDAASPDQAPAVVLDVNDEERQGAGLGFAKNAANRISEVTANALGAIGGGIEAAGDFVSGAAPIGGNLIRQIGSNLQRPAEAVSEMRTETEADLAARGMPSLGQTTDADLVNRAGQSVVRGGRAVTDWATSDESRANQIEFSKATDGSAWDAAKFMVTNPGTVADVVAPSLIEFAVPGGVAGRVGKGMLMADVAKGAETAAARVLAAGGDDLAVTAARTKALVEGTRAASQAAGSIAAGVQAGQSSLTQGMQAGEAIQNAPPEVLAEIPGFSDLAAQIGVDAARDSFATRAYDGTLGATLPLTLLTYVGAQRLGLSPFETKLAGGMTGAERAAQATGAAGRAARVGVRGLEEASGEFIQGASEQLGQNLGSVDSRVGAGDGVFKAGVIEGLVGFGVGGATGLMSGPVPRPDTPDGRGAIEIDKILSESGFKLNPAPNTVRAPAPAQGFDGLDDLLGGIEPVVNDPQGLLSMASAGPAAAVPLAPGAPPAAAPVAEGAPPAPAQAGVRNITPADLAPVATVDTGYAAGVVAPKAPDVAWLKANIDTLPDPTPEQLPTGSTWNFFKPGRADAVVDVSKLVATKEEQASPTAVRRLAASVAGVIPKRDAIDVRDNGDGTYSVLDGNGTLAAANAIGLTQMPVRIVEAPKGREGWRQSRGTLQPEASAAVTQAYEKADAAKPKYDSAVTQLAKAVGGEAQLASLKGRTRVNEKVLAESAEQGIGEADAVGSVKDLLRATIIVDSVEDARSALEQAKGKFKIFRAKDNLSEGTDARDDSGYRDANLVYTLPNGALAELQIMTRAMAEAKVEGHKDYESTRTLDEKEASGTALTPGEKSERKAVMAKMRASYEAAWAGSLAATSSANRSGDTRSQSPNGLSNADLADAGTNSVAPGGSTSRTQGSSSSLPGSGNQLTYSGDLTVAGSSTQNIALSGKGAPSNSNLINSEPSGLAPANPGDADSIPDVAGSDTLSVEVAALLAAAGAGRQKTRVKVVKTVKELAKDPRFSKVDGNTEGFFDPATETVYLIESALPTDPKAKIDRAAWVTWHELAGHFGLRRTFPGTKLGQMLDRAATNPTVAKLAAAIMAERGTDPDQVIGQHEAVEEALAELAAALRTDNMAGLMGRWGVDMPASVGPVEAVINNVIRAIKQALVNAFGGTLPYSDAQIREILANAMAEVRADSGRVVGDSGAGVRQSKVGADTEGSGSGAFMAAWEEATMENPFYGRERLVMHESGGAFGAVEVSKHGKDNNAIWIHAIRSAAPGNGWGNHILAQLTGMADRFGVTLKGGVEPFGTKTLSAKQLRDWYARKGFMVKKNMMGYSMTRAPKPPGTTPELVQSRRAPPLATDEMMKAHRAPDVQQSRKAVPRSSVGLFADPDSARKTLGLKATGRNLTRAVGLALNANTISKFGAIEANDRSDAAVAAMGSAIASEVAVQLESSGSATGTGLGWYSTNYPAAVKRLANRFPELGEDAGARNMFTALLAVTSNGEKVKRNLAMAVDLYGHWREGKPLSENAPNTRRADGLANNLAVIEKLEADHGYAGMTAHLLEELTVKEISAELRARGVKASTGYTADMTLPRAALYFGPKLGAFFANLAGSDGYLTMDLWWSRSINRYRGNLLVQPTTTGLARVRELLGLPEGSSDGEIIEGAAPHWESYTAKNFKDGTELEKASNTLIKAAKLGLNEAPENAGDRKLMYAAAKDAQAKLKKRGKSVSIADIQAALWYYEKRLYAALTGVGRDDIGYEEAINEQADQGGGSVGSFARGDRAGDRVGNSGGAGGEADGNVRGQGVRQSRSGPRGSEDGATAPLAGYPDGGAGPDQALVQVAERYAADRGIDLKRQAEYVKVNPARARRIAQAYEDMAHAPQDPAVRAAYSALIDQTVAQYRALEAAGYRFWLMDPDADPYAANPAAAMRDLRATKTMAVFPSDAGFGSSDLDVSNNPLLADTGISWPYGSLDGEPRPVLANDLFRAVHDAFGHGLEGAGFRAQGEENAWQSHVRLFTGAALGAITSETRGQNSWLNYGPHGETNKIAKVEDTIFADQKTGLMPEWTWAEGLASDAEVRQSRKPTPGTPTPLYVSRNVIDDGGLRQWAIDAGLTDVLALDDMHVTITYSREPVDIADAPAEGGDASARAGGRAVTLNTALAMPVKAMALNKGHDRYMAAGASHDYGDKYTPHVTLKYDATPEDTAALEAAPPFIGTVRLGPEVQDVLRPGGEEIDAGDANLDETLMEYGIPISSAVDASKRYSDGQRIFAVSEMDEGATEVTSMEMLRAYTPDQLLALTRAVAAEQGLPEPAQILQSRRPDPQTQTPAFKAWFGDSKVVDENGDPLVVYHATDADFDTFEIGDVGFHFGSAESAASRADGVRDNITRRWSRQREKTLATYLSIKNPLRLPDAGDWSDPDQVAGIVSDMYTTDEAWMDRYQLAADKLVPDFSNDNGESFRAIFEDMGYDGIVYDNVGEGGGDSFIAFRPNQIKSATANSGAFDPENPSILQERRTPSKAHQERGGKLAGLSVQGFPVATLAQSGSNWVLTQKTKKQALFTEIRRVMQDRMINVRNALDDIQSAIGGPISDLANLYQAENLMHGKAADGVRRVQDAFIDPLKALIKRTAIPVGDVERYLWAKHALERNARIAQINPGMQDGGSGLTDQEAQEILDGFDKAGLTPKLEMIDRRTQQLRKDTLDTLKESGQITPTEYASLLGMYQHYVPLRGRAGEEGEARVGGGKGVDMRGKPVRRALGRRTQPANILGELVGDSERAQVVAAKAEVARTLLRAALEYPNPDFWVVEPVTVEPRYSEASGEVYLGIANDQNEEDVVIVKHKGKPYKVRLVDPDLRAAMKNVGVEGFEAVGKYLGWVNRWLSAVFTRYNPAFVPINMIRDWIQGTIGVGSQLGAKSILDVARIYPGAVAGLISEARGNGDASVPDAQKTPTDWAREFLESGASTGYATFQDTAMLQSQIENEMATFAQMVRSGQPVAAVGEAVRRSQLFQTIETANEIVENGTRLSTYIHMRKSGASREKAATFAKNLTVNFNRKGSGAAVGNAMFLFFNASIQGSHRVLKLLRDPRVVATLVAAGTAQFVMAMTMGAAKYEDDDETLWEKIPDHVRQKAFVIPTGYSEDGSPQYVAIPMPFGFNMFTYLGGYPALMSSKTWMSRNNAKRKVPGDLARAGIDAFSVVPIGEEGWYWPTVARIFVNMQANKDDLGRRIRASEGFGAKLPRSSQGRADTAGGYKAIATALNRLGGGDDYTKPITAMLDYAPEDIEYMVNMFAGGPGNIMNQLWKTAEKVNADVPLAASDIPVSSRVIGSTRSPSVTSKFFYESKEIMDKGVLQLKDAYVSGGWDAFQAKRDELGPQFAGVIPAVYKTSSREKGYRAGQIRTSETGAPILIGYPGSTYEAFKQVSTGVSDYGDAIRATYNNTALSSAERRREVERLQMERADAMRYFLDAWNYDASSLTGASD